MNRSWAALSVGMLSATIAACAAEEPAPPVRYSGPISECPTLNAPQAQRFTGSEKAVLVPTMQPETFALIDCKWLPDVRPAVNVDLMFHRDASAGTAFTNAGATFVDIRDQALTRAKVDATVRVRELPSGTAVLLAEGEGEFLTQHTLIGNVVIMVRVFEAKTSPADTGARAAELMDGLTAASTAITGEVAGQLR